VRNWIIVVALLVAPAPAFTQKVNLDSDRYDTRTKQLVWRATGTDRLSDQPEQNTVQMNKAVAKMFEQYPPTQK
jgi:Domain of unknown function (DUF4136)